MAVNLHAFITERNGALYVHVGRKETCALYILNCVGSEVFKMKPFNTEQSSNISSYVMLRFNKREVFCA